MVVGKPESRLDRFWRRTLPPTFPDEAVAVDEHLREGRFQRSMSLMAGASSVLRRAGGFLRTLSRQLRSGNHVDARRAQRRDDRRGPLGFFSKWAARTVLRWTSAVTLLDSLVGFYFHARGVARKPAAGGCRWRTSSWDRRFSHRYFLGSARTWVSSRLTYGRRKPRRSTYRANACADWLPWRLAASPRRGARNCARAVFKTPRVGHDPEHVFQRIRGAVFTLQK